MLAALPLLPLHAQDSLLLRDYSYVKTLDPWLTQQNAAGLSRYAMRSIANADVSLSYGGGHLTPSYGSPSVLGVTAAIESFYRLTPRAVVYGAISYDNHSGSDMTGSAFMHLPATNGQWSKVNGQWSMANSHYPFDIVEDSLTNAGRKHRDTYRLTGAFAYRVSDGFAVGARLDYLAANYAKYKDLRHQNKLNDLTATAGLLVTPLSWLSAGADYSYHRQTESLQFSMNGKSEKVYKSLIDYGAGLGLVEQFGNEGYTDKSREIPLFEDCHGGSLQLEVHPQRAATPDATTTAPLSSWRLFAALSLRHATGYYGRPSPYTVTFTRHKRNTLALDARLTYAPARHASRFFLDVRYANEHLTNAANTYRALTADNSATYYEYYDAAETTDNHWHTLAIDYTMHLGIRHELPAWTVTAGYHRQQQDITAYLFPHYRQQQLTTHDVGAGATRHLLLRRAVLSLTVHAALRTGSGAPYADGTFAATDGTTSATATPGGKQSAPATKPTLLYRDYHYLTATQLCVGIGARYAFRFPGTPLLTYVRTDVSHRSSQRSDYPLEGPDRPSRTTASIAIGCTF